jgi:hypothetical protein
MDCINQYAHVHKVRTNLLTPLYFTSGRGNGWQGISTSLNVLTLYLSSGRERVSKSLGKKRVNFFKSPYDEDLGGSLFSDKMEKSEQIS